ncbi:putative membrane protein [Helicobacter pylori Hp H-4]|nr:putative membrane protein [Helicobacter pylori Hp H-4]
MVKICFKFRYNCPFNVFQCFLSFWHGLFLLVVVWAFFKRPF